MKRVTRAVRFTVVQGVLVREVQLSDGRRYVHRASLQALQEVAWFLEEHAEVGATSSELWTALPGVAATQSSVALEFLKERGCLVTRLRRNYLATKSLFEDAMTEFYWLEHTVAQSWDDSTDAEANRG